MEILSRLMRIDGSASQLEDHRSPSWSVARRQAGSGLPRVWLLQGAYQGDNAQVRSIGEVLAWPVELKQIHFTSRRAVRRDFWSAIDWTRSSELAPPWPDVVVGCGRFFCKLAQVIKKQSGDRVIHVQIGRIGCSLDKIDLMISLPQYGIPRAGNVIPLTLPIVQANRQRQADLARHWQPLLAHLPRPWTAVLIGGPAMTAAFSDVTALHLLDRLKQIQAMAGGSLVLVYGPRTPDDVKDVLARGLATAGLRGEIIGWPPPDPNPYLGLLAMADRFVVTCDSVSMIADASLTGRPVEIFMLPIADFKTRLSSRGLGLSLDTRRRRRRRADQPDDILDRLRDALVKHHLMRPWDDLRDVLHQLDSAGLTTSGTAPADGPLMIDMNAAATLQRRELALIRHRITDLVTKASAIPCASI